MSTEIGFIGLGSMGSRMVKKFLGQGLRVCVYDVNRAAVQSAVALGATEAASPAQVASQTSTVLVSLPTPDVVRAVALGSEGIIHGSKIKIYVDLSTTGTSTAKQVGDALAGRGISVLDAPVSGGPIGVDAGSLAIMVSGDRQTFETVKPILGIIGSGTTLVGDKIGQGQALKLLNNMLVATTWAAACEAATLGAKAGLDPEVMATMLNKSSGRSWVTENLLAKHGVTRTFNFGFRLSLMMKDVRLALEEAEHLGVTMFTSRAAGQIYSHAMAHGSADADYTALLRTIEEWGNTIVGRDEEQNQAAAR